MNKIKLYPMLFSVEFSDKTLVLKNIIILVAFMVLISVHSGFSQCNNPSQYPADLVIVDSDATTIISTNQFASEYNVTTGYLGGEVCKYTSSVPTDYITLRRADTNELIAHGPTPLFINYDIEYGDVEMHINSSSSCSISFLGRITEVTLTTVSSCPPPLISFARTRIKEGINPLGKIYPNYFIPTNGYFIMDTVTFDVTGSLSGSYFMTIRDSVGGIEFFGVNPLKFINYNGTKYFKLQVNENTACDPLINPVDVNIKIDRSFCNHSDKKTPLKIIDINEGYNVLNYNQPSGTHNVSQGYPNYSKCKFTDENGRFITLRSSINDSVVGYGFGSAFLTYTPNMGKIETHINEDSECLDEFLYNTGKIDVTVTFPCESVPTAGPTISLSCGSSIESIVSNQSSLMLTGMLQDESVSIYSDFDVTIRKASNDSIIYSGPFFKSNYQSSWGNLKISVTAYNDCSFDVRSLVRASCCLCDNPVGNPPNIINVINGDNFVPSVLTGQYNFSKGYKNKDVVTFTSSNPNDYFSIQSNNFYLHGKSPLSFIYDKSKMSIVYCNLNKDKQCSADAISRNITINVKPSCSNNVQYPATKIATCNVNTIIASQQYAGDYNVTEYYYNGSFCTYNSSVPTDIITLKGGSTQDSVIASGKSPLSIYYSNAYGPEIYMHISKDSLCGTENIFRTTSVLQQCNCILEPIKKLELCNLQDSFNYESPFSFHGLVNNAITISSKPGHTITIWNVSDKSIVATGLGSVSFSYIANTVLGVSVTSILCENVAPFTVIKMTRSVPCLDSDSDGVYDISDNCDTISNAQQQDEDYDGIGDACENDFLSTNNIGIGTNNPMTKLQVKDGSIYLEDKDAGVLMKAANGTCWMVKMGNTGVVKTNQVDCPKSN
jgi:hypothetical protein